MKKIIALLLLCALAVGMLAACKKETTSDYDAEGLVRSSSATAGSANFQKLSGHLVFDLHAQENSELSYLIRLDEGEAKLSYIVAQGAKHKVAAIASGDPAEGSAGSFSKGDAVFVIFETKKDCRGAITVRLAAKG